MMKQLVATLFLLSLSAPGYAQPYINTVWEQIQENHDENIAMGYSMKNYFIGKIGSSDENTYNFNLRSGKRYLIEGVCDEDCEDLDLYISDAKGNELDRDLAVDNSPLLFFEPPSSGRYEIKVSMFACNVEPCYFGLSIFEK